MHGAQSVRFEVVCAEMSHVAGHQEGSTGLDRGGEDGQVLGIGVRQIPGFAAVGDQRPVPPLTQHRDRHMARLLVTLRLGLYERAIHQSVIR